MQGNRDAHGYVDLADSAGVKLAEDWPDDVKEAYHSFLTHDPEALVARERLGDLAFTEIGPVINQLRQTLAGLAEERWAELPPIIVNGNLLEQLNQLNNLIGEIQGFELNQSDPAGNRTNLINRLTENANWFKTNVRQYTVKAIARQAVEQVAGFDDELGDAATLRQELSQIKHEKDAVIRDLESQRDLVAGLRTVSGESASNELAQVFVDRAKELQATAKRWLIALGVAGVVALAGGVGTFLILKPHHGANASDVGRLTLSVFILGLLVYAVRVCAQQFRANRHLEAVARSKAAALSTFTRFSGAVEEESVRSTLALTLAQAVFATEETGFIEASADRVTLVDHALPRLPSWDGQGS